MLRGEISYYMESVDKKTKVIKKYFGSKAVFRTVLDLLLEAKNVFLYLTSGPEYCVALLVRAEFVRWS